MFIVAVEDGVLPHERVGRHPDELEEERRLAFVGITRAKDELQLSYAVTRDFRGVRRRTIPSSFLMEMPREEMELVDEATAHIATSRARKARSWDEPESTRGLGAAGRAGMTSLQSDHWQLRQTLPSNPPAEPIRFSASPPRRSRRPPPWPATIVGRNRPRPAPRFARRLPARHDRDHPEYGPGKIVALSGAGKNRRATIQFATVGQKKIILAHSAGRRDRDWLRPARPACGRGRRRACPAFRKCRWRFPGADAVHEFLETPAVWPPGSPLRPPVKSSPGSLAAGVSRGRSTHFDRERGVRRIDALRVKNTERCQNSKHQGLAW